MAQMIKVQLLNPDGTTEDVDLDLDLDSLSMREAVRLEESLGEKGFAALMSGDLTLTDIRPSTIRAMIFAKLATLRPDVGLDGFDLDLGALGDALAEPEPPKG